MSSASAPASPHGVGLFVHDLSPTAVTGVQHYAGRLAGALADREDTALWLIGHARRPVPPELWPRVPKVRYPAPRAMHAAWTVIGRPRLDRWARPDVLHVTHPAFPVSTTAPLVVTIHDLFPLDHPAWAPRRVRRRFRAAIAQAAGEASAIITPSRHVAERVMQRGIEPGRIHPIPHGLDPAWFLQERVVGPPTLVTVGALTPRKRVAELARSNAEVLRIHPDLTWHVIGPDGPATPRFDDAIDKHGLRAATLRSPAMGDAELRRTVAGAMAAVHAADDEGYGLTLLEAMGAGTPVVARPTGAIPEVTDGAALLVDTLDPHQLLAAVEELRDPESWRRWSTAGRRIAGTRSWAACARAHVDVYARTTA